MGSYTRFDVYEAELKKLLEEEIVRLKDEMSLGLLKTYEDYKYCSGKIAALSRCIEYMDEASSIVSKKLGA